MALKIKPDCIPCVLSVRAKELEMLGIRGDKATLILARLAKLLADSALSGEPLAVAATRTFRELKKVVGVQDPYREVKKQATKEAILEAERIKSVLAKLDGYDRFYAAVKIALLGNSLDFGVAGYKPLSPQEAVSRLETMKIAIDDTAKLYRLVISRKPRVLYLLDNAGEAVFDGILAGEISRLGGSVVCVAKSNGGFQNDVTLEDARESGLESVCRLVPSGTDASSIFLDEVGDELRGELKRADVVVAKGMAHYEYLADVKLEKPVVFLLRAKCRVIAASLGVSVGDYAVVFRG